MMGSLRAYATETVHIIDASRTLATGIGGTLINVNVASLPCWEGEAMLLKCKPSRNKVRMMSCICRHSSLRREAVNAIGHYR